KRQSNSNLFLSSRGTRQKHVGYIRGGDKKHQTDCSQKDQERCAHVPHIRSLHRLNDGGPSLVCLGILAFHLRGQILHLLSGLREATTVAEPGHHAQIVSATGGSLAGIESIGEPIPAAFTAEVKTCRHHADDGGGFAVERNVPAYEVSVGCEGTAP